MWIYTVQCAHYVKNISNALLLVLKDKKLIMTVVKRQIRDAFTGFSWSNIHLG